ncbi:alpha/beta hydrolase [Ascidiimonas sp. W6]|uniref:alpha/beta hydrolase n=1 Tax=Ascidiimonas meishanensis TaxID=3128903 RepID=UPI0030ED400B
MLNYFQQKLIFKSTKLENSHIFDFKQPFEEIHLKATDGALLHGVHFKIQNPKGIVLYLHGNARSMDYWGHWGEQLASAYQRDVVVMDYRGYGKSRGVRDHKAMLEDTRLFYDYCETLFPEHKIVVFGRSLGGAFASYISRQKDPGLLIIESSFTTLAAVVKNMFQYLPVATLLKYPFQSEENIKHIRARSYFIHGTEDRIVPYELGQELYALSGSNHKEFFTIEGGFHNNLREYNTYFKALETIFNQV